MNTFLLHCYFEWNVHFTYDNNLGALDLLMCVSVDWQAHSSFSAISQPCPQGLPLDDFQNPRGEGPGDEVAQSPSVAIESNLNRLFHFPRIFIKAWSILSLLFRYISFHKNEDQRIKQFSIRNAHWETRPDYDLRGVCVFIKIHKYIASSPVRSLNNLNRLKKKKIIIIINRKPFSE